MNFEGVSKIKGTGAKVMAPSSFFFECLLDEFGRRGSVKDEPEPEPWLGFALPGGHAFFGGFILVLFEPFGCVILFSGACLGRLCFGDAFKVDDDWPFGLLVVVFACLLSTFLRSFLLFSFLFSGAAVFGRLDLVVVLTKEAYSIVTRFFFGQMEASFVKLDRSMLIKLGHGLIFQGELMK
ncbi:hypothetical protein CLU79DRAFT_191464 [Phycomyces nitens]|nr:hypothetical protein CLU79DRAFT_191464 [Phycomyces nitens]